MLAVDIQNHMVEFTDSPIFYLSINLNFFLKTLSDHLHSNRMSFKQLRIEY